MGTFYVAASLYSCGEETQLFPASRWNPLSTLSPPSATTAVTFHDRPVPHESRIDDEMNERADSASGGKPTTSGGRD